MHRSGSDNALRHLDFAFFDVVLMQICFHLMYWLTGHSGVVYTVVSYRVQAIILFIGQLALGLFSDIYDHVFVRDVFSEFTALLRNVGEIWLLSGAFILLSGVPAKADEMIVLSFIFFDLDFFVREWNKKRHLKKGLPMRKIVVVTVGSMVDTVIDRLRQYQTTADHQLVGILLLDESDPARFKGYNVPVYNAQDNAILEEISHWWIDDAFVLLHDDSRYPKQLMENLLLMGITIHTGLSVLDEFPYSEIGLQELGSYKVLTNSVKFVSDRAALMKRLLDIAGGLVGTLMTGILFIFIAPMIYIKSPGPIFFRQARIGQNGRVFYIYKFRSMYMDAEARKAELMAKNKIQDGLMFKMDDDPRIIGSERKGKDGKPKGIGNFIRNNSLDEFPQFFNVLKGEMSLVGTRPPTIDEWNHYDLHHRIRMSAKPGITGMWQVSGRSQITDFEEVVALDKMYIEHWSFLLDIRILLKTVKVVLKHEGAV